MARDRSRLALDLICVLATGALALRWPTLALIAALVAGSVSRWIDGRSWSTGRPNEPVMVAAGVAAGVAAAALAVWLADPAITELTGRSVEWTRVTSVRGQLGTALVVAMLVSAQAAASELVFRRWILDRAEGVVGAWPAIVIAAVAEAWVAGGHLGSRAGVAVAGLACGLLYVGSGGRLATSIAARVAFELCAIALVWQRIL